MRARMYSLQCRARADFQFRILPFLLHIAFSYTSAYIKTPCKNVIGKAGWFLEIVRRTTHSIAHAGDVQLFRERTVERGNVHNLEAQKVTMLLSEPLRCNVSAAHFSSMFPFLNAVQL